MPLWFVHISKPHEQLLAGQTTGFVPMGTALSHGVAYDFRVQASLDGQLTWEKSKR